MCNAQKKGKICIFDEINPQKPMKNFLFTAILISSFANAQTYYKKISEKDISTERQTIAKNFIQDFLQKCEDKNYTKFENYNIVKKFEMLLDEKLESICKKNEEELGKIELLSFDSAHINKYSINKDPYELFIFNAKTEKNPDRKFLSVWIYQDKNYIRGIITTKEKPINPNKRD
jgi:hypothetical protein